MFLYPHNINNYNTVNINDCINLRMLVSYVLRKSKIKNSFDIVEDVKKSFACCRIMSNNISIVLTIVSSLSEYSKNLYQFYLVPNEKTNKKNLYLHCGKCNTFDEKVVGNFTKEKQKACGKCPI